MIRKTVAFANIPVHKSIPNTKYIVDCFNIYIPDCKIFFLSHFHADHYIGLNKKFTGTLFCSQTTASLVHKNLRVIENQIKRLNMFTWYEIEKNHYVYLADANHCPGAVVFIFKIVDRFYFHCGDFRAANEFYNQFGSLKDVEIFDIENKKINEISLVDFYNFNYECIINVNKSFKINEINHEEIGFNNKNFIDLQEIHQLRELKEKNENNTNMKEMHEINQLCEFKERNEINLSEVVLHNIENNGNLLDTKEYFTNEKLGINNTNNFSYKNH
ncbi:5' exonuclease Apollo [Gurleya vavrai]